MRVEEERERRRGRWRGRRGREVRGNILRDFYGVMER